MLNVQPQTYNELMRVKRCYELTKYFVLSEELLEKIYNFLAEDPKHEILTTMIIINFMDEDTIVTSYSAEPKTQTFSSIKISEKVFNVVPLH